VNTPLTSEQRKTAAEFSGMAATIARRIAERKGMLHMLDDLRGVAFAALSRATTTYKPGPAKISTHIWCRVTGAVRDAVRKEAMHLSLKDALEVAAGIAIEHEPSTEAEEIAAVDAATGEIMLAFATSCGGAELRENAEGRLLQTEARANLRRALAELAPEDRLFFELRHVEGLPWAEVAARFGIKERAARDRNKKIRKALRKALRGPGT